MNSARLTVSVPDAAKILGISRSLAYELVKNGQLPSLKLGVKRVVVPKIAIEKMLNEASSFNK